MRCILSREMPACRTGAVPFWEYRNEFHHGNSYPERAVLLTATEQVFLLRRKSYCLQVMRFVVPGRDLAPRERHATQVAKRQGGEELWHDARIDHVLEAGSQLDQRGLTEGRADEADAHRQTETVAHGNVDDWIADDRRQRRSPEDEVIAVDQVSGPGW